MTNPPEAAKPNPKVLEKIRARQTFEAICADKPVSAELRQQLIDFIQGK